MSQSDAHLTMKTFLAVVGVVVTISISVFGYFGSRIQTSEGKIETLTVTDAKTGERLSSVEARTNNVEKRLDSIESKLDRILERLNK